MKKIVLTVVLGLLTVMQGKAQNEVGTLTLMPKIGGCWSTMSASDIYYIEDYDGKASAKGRLGFVGGLEAEYQLRRQFSLSAGVMYAHQGMTNEDVPDMLKDYKVTLDYLNIPVMAHLYIAPRLAVQVGVQPGFLLRGRLSGEEPLYGEDGTPSGWHSYSGDDTLHRTFDFGIPIGLSYDFDRLRIECRYCLGLYDTTKYELKERNRSLQLTLGYRFAL